MPKSENESSSSVARNHDVRYEQLDRLRWNLFGPIEEIEVLDIDGPDEKDVVWRPFLRPQCVCSR